MTDDSNQRDDPIVDAQSWDNAMDELYGAVHGLEVWDIADVEGRFSQYGPFEVTVTFKFAPPSYGDDSVDDTDAEDALKVTDG